MKNLYFGFSVIMLFILSSCASSRTYTQGNYDQNNYAEDYSNQPSPGSNQPSPVSYQQFYDDLSPYGNWVNYQNYGYAWVPNVSGFRPYYTNGYWAYSNYGWTWVSNYNWGWAPFHYGRWVADMSFGWVWIPGNEWAPAWVSWRGGGDYYGWAPLEPGMDVNVSMGSIPQNNWAFVPRRYINSPRINNYYVDQSRNVTIINNTAIINNTTVINNGNNGGRTRPIYNQGPSVAEVERSTNSTIRPFRVVESNRPGETRVDRNSIKVYRPAVTAQPANSSNARPARVLNTRELQANRPENNIERPNVLRPATTPGINNSGTRRDNSNSPVTRELNGNRNQPQPQVSTPAIQNPPARNNERGNPAAAPTRSFNTDQKPTINREQNPPIMNNTTPAKEPLRNLNRDQNPSMNRQNTVPVRQAPTNQQPVNNSNTQPRRQFENNNGIIHERQPEGQQRNVRVETVRPAQPVVRETQPERKLNEKE